MPDYPAQYATIDQVLDGLAACLKAATGYTDRNVVEWNHEARPDVTATVPFIWYRWVGEEYPNPDSGAGRAGMPIDVQIEVRVCTRSFRDRGAYDRQLARQHLALVYIVKNAMIGRFLYSAYDAAVGGDAPMPTQAASVISHRGTMFPTSIPAPDHTARPEQGYIETRISLTVPTVLKVTLNDVPAAE